MSKKQNYFELISYLKLIPTIIFTPIIWLANFLTGHKNNLLEWHFNYGPYFIHIKTKYKKEFPSDDLLIASYILFLARYFYICDDRQTELIRNLLLKEIGDRKNNPKELSNKVWDTIYQTLNEMEKYALSKLYSNALRGTPPLFYSEEESKRPYAKYSFLVFQQRDGNLAHVFHMSAGADIIFLPLTVAVLYNFVIDKLSNKDKKEKLDNSIVDLLKNHSAIDCRSTAGQNELPNEVISHNNLNY